MIEIARPRGRVGTIIVSLNAFVPKPQTPFQWEPIQPERELDRKIKYLTRAFKTIPNVEMRAMSFAHRHASSDDLSWATAGSRSSFWKLTARATGDRRCAVERLRAAPQIARRAPAVGRGGHRAHDRVHEERVPARDGRTDHEALPGHRPLHPLRRVRPAQRP